MNKRIVLKSVLAVAIVGFVLVFSSCKEEKKLIGKWKSSGMTIKELKCSDPAGEAFLRLLLGAGQGMMADSMNLGTMEFTKDGKVISNSGGQSQTGTYKATDKQLTITMSDGIPVTMDYSIPKKKEMILEMDLTNTFGEMGDVEFGTLSFKILKLVVTATYQKQ